MVPAIQTTSTALLDICLLDTSYFCHCPVVISPVLIHGYPTVTGVKLSQGAYGVMSYLINYVLFVYSYIGKKTFHIYP